LICQRLVGLAINDKEIKEKMEDYLEYFPETYKRLYKGILPTGEVDSSLEKMLELISLRFSFESANFKEDKLEDEFKQLVHELKLGYLKAKQQEIRKDMEKLERAGNDEGFAKKMKEFDNVSKEIHNIGRSERK